MTQPITGEDIAAKWAAKLKRAEQHYENAGHNGSHIGCTQAQRDIDFCKEAIADITALRPLPGDGPSRGGQQTAVAVVFMAIEPYLRASVFLSEVRDSIASALAPLPVGGDREGIARALRWFIQNRKSIEADVLSAHRSRGNGTTQWMTEEDRDFRTELKGAFDAAAAMLSSSPEAVK